MIKYPRLKYNFHAEFIDDEKILLVSEKGSTLLTGRLYNLVMSEIQYDGITPEELVTRLSGKASGFEVIYALDMLEKKGYITESSPQLPNESSAYWNAMGIDAGKLTEVFREKPVSIETVGSLPVEPFRCILKETGIQVIETGVLRVILTDDYQRGQIRDINRESLETNQPWLLVKPLGVELWAGPIFVPGQTGCWECLKQRLEINRPGGAFYREHKGCGGHLYIPAAHIPATFQMAAGQVALEIVKWLYFDANETLAGKIVTTDTRSLSSRSHVLVKRPQCKSCGDPDFKIEAHPIVLKRGTDRSREAMGGYREVPAEITLEKYRHHVSPITGVMPKLEPYHSIKGTPIYNYSSGRNIALRSKTLFWLNQHIRSGNGGKGKTWIQAETGALCEAVERYCLTYHGYEPKVRGSLETLGNDGIHPNDCMNYSESQYQDREAINQGYTKFYYLVPVPFDTGLEMDWTPVYSLTGKNFKYLPSCFCYAQYPAADELRLFAYPDSNGSAAGNTLEEAILQGFLELVERDSVAIWWYNKLRKPGVDLSGFNEPYFLELTDYYKSLGRSLIVLDLTADLGIPAFAAISHRLDKKRQEIVFGFGAHVDAKLGIERALVELNQLLPIAHSAGSGRDRGAYLTKDKSFVDWLNNATMENQPYLAPDETTVLKSASDYSPLCPATIYDSVNFCIEAADGQGLEPFVLDMTHPDVGLNVVKVIVPGMRHFWQRLAPGRLYDVPVKMGWLDRPYKEEELNSIGLFI